MLTVACSSFEILSTAVNKKTDYTTYLQHTITTHSTMYFLAKVCETIHIMIEYSAVNV